jgi:hypothetical protein
VHVTALRPCRMPPAQIASPPRLSALPWEATCRPGAARRGGSPRERQQPREAHRQFRRVHHRPHPGEHQQRERQLFTHHRDRGLGNRGRFGHQRRACERRGGGFGLEHLDDDLIDRLRTVEGDLHPVRVFTGGCIVPAAAAAPVHAGLLVVVHRGHRIGGAVTRCRTTMRARSSPQTRPPSRFTA